MALGGTYAAHGRNTRRLDRNQREKQQRHEDNQPASAEERALFNNHLRREFEAPGILANRWSESWGAAANNFAAKHVLQAAGHTVGKLTGTVVAATALARMGYQHQTVIPVRRRNLKGTTSLYRRLELDRQ
jgi:hypothetical protein